MLYLDTQFMIDKHLGQMWTRFEALRAKYCSPLECSDAERGEYIDDFTHFWDACCAAHTRFTEKCNQHHTPI